MPDTAAALKEAHATLTAVRGFVRAEVPTAVGTLAELDRVIESIAKALSS